MMDTSLEMMKWNPGDLRHFLEVTRTLNISRAAERLGIGQPTVSQAVQRLERYFGTALLDRYKTGVRLTAAGERLRDAGHATLEYCARLKEQVLASETIIQGHFVIGCHPSVAIYSMPLLLKDLLLEHKSLSISLLHGLSREVLEAVVSFRADFAIVVNPVRHPDLVIKVLAQDRVRFWSTADAITDTLICDPSLMQSQKLIARMRCASFRRTIESSNLEVIATLGEAGVGVAILPSRVAQRYHKLQAFRADAPYVADQICLSYRADRHLSAGAREIVGRIRTMRF